jgi:serine/threonine-protein kinase RsbW
MNRHPVILELRLPSRVAREALEKSFRGEVAASTANALEVCLEEGVINAITHGHGRDASRPIVVRVEIGPEDLKIDVTDTGPGFNPEQLPALDPTELREHGRGWHLMKTMMDTVTYQRGTGGNVLRMTKKLPPPQSR